MTILAVSFVLFYDDDYAKRYNSVTEFLEQQGDVWDETTSFVLLETSVSADLFEAMLYVSTDIDANRDKVLVLDVTGVPGATRGNLLRPALLRAMLPKVQQN